ncbi:UPF0488 protein C8orf33 homolog [Myripristis murdjan]|uniref:Zgc:112185 n=1 Tax=Myripristis murdjan TaxID=586833 RepID=A0A667Z326_9TELE|nr:UPF0488 protein C8orf33 homolog [Myripristis murdjan]
MLFIDIKAESNNTSTAAEGAHNPLWTRSDNSFRFNFLPEGRPAPQQDTPSSAGTPPAAAAAFTGQGAAGFAFNFQIPPATPEDMTTESPEAGDSHKNRAQEEEDARVPQQQGSSSTKTKKKKKKPGRKKASEESSSSEVQEGPSSAEGSHGEETALTAEEQLKRELDWCIEQLELGMRTQKGTPKQKEEASRALKTLRSSKAPLAKKRQVMRAATGDYRRKMQEEKDTQFRLIERALAAAQVKAVPNSSKKSVFHRRAGASSQTAAAQENNNQQTSQSQARAAEERPPAQEEETPAFVFTPSKEEFHFNFF